MSAPPPLSAPTSGPGGTALRYTPVVRVFRRNLRRLRRTRFPRGLKRIGPSSSHLSFFLLLRRGVSLPAQWTVHLRALVVRLTRTPRKMKRFRIHFPLRPKTPLTRKGKNARMGKGKGKFKGRWALVAPAGSTVLTGYAGNVYVARRLAILLERRTRCPRSR